jgi:hypothetical protein
MPEEEDDRILEEYQGKTILGRPSNKWKERTKTDVQYGGIIGLESSRSRLGAGPGSSKHGNEPNKSVTLTI